MTAKLNTYRACFAVADHVTGYVRDFWAKDDAAAKAEVAAWLALNRPEVRLRYILNLSAAPTSIVI